jgi:trimethylamine--corrinoid protein Co-methyltransferase
MPIIIINPNLVGFLAYNFTFLKIKGNSKLNNVKPKVTVLEEGHINYIIDNSIRLLESTGIKIDSLRIVDLLMKQIGSSAVSGNRVKIPRELVNWALGVTPAKIKIFNRQGDPAFQVGDGSVHCGIGVTALYYQDIISDELTPFKRCHMQEMVRLGEKLKNYEMISTVGVIQDVPIQNSDLIATLEMTANTTKPLVLLISDGQKFPKVLEMLESIHGNLHEKPYLIPYLNPVTPLVMVGVTFFL